MVLPVLSSLFVFLAIASLALWQVQRLRGSVADARVRELASGQQVYQRLQEVPFENRVVLPVAEGFARFIINLLPPAFIARTRRNLIAAGQPMGISAFFLLVLILGALLPTAGFLLTWAATDGDIPPRMIVFGPILAAAGVLIPFVWLRGRVRRRQAAIWRSLPDAFDLMTTCVEAGLGLDSAFSRVAEKLKGPVAEEFAEMLREVSMGKARRNALRDMGERTGVADLKTFANMMVQAEELGTSLGAALRAQASDIRRHRRQRAEEEARRAPAKMVFPLVFFILPSLFIVILGPLMIELVKVLGD